MRIRSAGTTLRLAIPALAAFLFIGAAVAPAAIAMTGQSSAKNDAARIRWVSTLRTRSISVSFNHVPFAEAVGAISKKTGVPIQALMQEQPAGTEGIDPAITVDLEAKSQPAILVLEKILQQAGDAAHAEVRWQATAGGIEAGPKSRLMRSSALERRAYSVIDLGFHPADFQVPQLPSGGNGGGSGGGSGGGTGGGSGGGSGGSTPPPFTPSQNEARYKKIKELIQSTVETDVWSETSGGPCTIAVFNDKLIVVAPDFVHREISDTRPTLRQSR